MSIFSVITQMYYVDCERFPQRIMTLAFVRVGAKLYSTGRLYTFYRGHICSEVSWVETLG